MRVLSLGAGVQSTTLALLAARGIIEPPAVAIFADTGWEPRAVYEHLAWLRSPNVALPFPVRIVQKGNLRDDLLARRNTTGGRFAAIPFFTLGPEGQRGKGRRQCTSEYKLEPIVRELRALLGKPGRAYIRPGSVQMLIGISTDEAHRMKHARQQYISNLYPLIDLGWSRQRCLDWLKAEGYPQPPKSSCIGCPFHNNEYWRHMRDTAPAEWAEAVAVDKAMRQGNARGMRALEFMHRQRVPLDEADLEPKPQAEPEPDLFGQECEGMCGN